MPERSSKKKRPVDVNELAKSIVDDATSGEEPDEAEDSADRNDDSEPEKNPAAVALGRLGGLKGGKARAEKLTAEERSKIAKKAAAARWTEKESDV